MAMALQPFIIGLPFRLKYLDKALQHILRHKEVWLTTGAEMANWYTSLADALTIPSRAHVGRATGSIRVWMSEPADGEKEARKR